jgi:hypothetical protein
MRTITIAVEMGDALTFVADVLALKYAQALHGVDKLVVNRLSQSAHDINAMLP